MTGHLLGAAGAIEAIACIKSIGQSIIPPTINLNQLDAEISSQLDFTSPKAVEREISVVLNNTFGFGGHTVTTIFRKYQF